MYRHLLAVLVSSIYIHSSHAAGPTATIQANPGPTDQPRDSGGFFLTFNIGSYDVSECTETQKESIKSTYGQLWQMAMRANLWRNPEEDPFHDWEMEATYWMGPSAHIEYNSLNILTNFRRMKWAIDKQKSPWWQTWIRVTCDTVKDDKKKDIECGYGKNILNFQNSYGWWWNGWDEVRWNICPDYWDLEDFFTATKRVAQRGSADDAKIIENYRLHRTKEQWMWYPFIQIRSIGIPEMQNDLKKRVEAPADVWFDNKDHFDNPTERRIRDELSYFFFAAAITIPREWNWQARPLRPAREKDPRFTPQPPTYNLLSTNTSSSNTSYGSTGYGNNSLGMPPPGFGAIETLSSNAPPASSHPVGMAAMTIDTQATTYSRVDSPASTMNCFSLAKAGGGGGGGACDCGTTMGKLTTTVAAGDRRTTLCAVGNTLVPMFSDPRTTGAAATLVPSSSNLSSSAPSLSSSLSSSSRAPPLEGAPSTTKAPPKPRPTPSDVLILGFDDRTCPRGGMYSVLSECKKKCETEGGGVCGKWQVPINVGGAPPMPGYYPCQCPR